jgi:DNA-binding response OmpR family regulator
MTVLVVEDQPNLAEPLQDLLEEQGHGCLTACDVEEAVWMMQTVHVDVLALDLEVPGRSAREWLVELCLARPELARATVAISGSPAGTEEILAIRASGASLIQKPFPIQVLHEAVMDKLRRVSPPLASIDLPTVSLPPSLDEPEEH